MNPLRWQREHQVALAVATLLGFAAGLAYGYSRGETYRFSDWLYYAISPNYTHHGDLGWSIFGAIIGAATIYVAHLMKR